MHVQVHTLGMCVVPIKSKKFVCQRNISKTVFHTMFDPVSSPTHFAKLLKYLFHPAFDIVSSPMSFASNLTIYFISHSTLCRIQVFLQDSKTTTTSQSNANITSHLITSYGNLQNITSCRVSEKTKFQGPWNISPCIQPLSNWDDQTRPNPMFNLTLLLTLNIFIKYQEYPCIRHHAAYDFTWHTTMCRAWY